MGKKIREKRFWICPPPDKREVPGKKVPNEGSIKERLRSSKTALSSPP